MILSSVDTDGDSDGQAGHVTHISDSLNRDPLHIAAHVTCTVCLYIIIYICVSVRVRNVKAARAHSRVALRPRTSLCCTQTIFTARGVLWLCGTSNRSYSQQAATSPALYNEVNPFVFISCLWHSIRN